MIDEHYVYTSRRTLVPPVGLATAHPPKKNLTIEGPRDTLSLFASQLS